MTDQFLEFTGHELEAVASITRAGEGWDVVVTVVETRRIPDTTDILAEYRLEADAEGGTARL